MNNPLNHDAITQRFNSIEWDEKFGALIIPVTEATEIAKWLRDDDSFLLDYCSNVTGIDYLDREIKEKVENEEGKMETVTRTDPSRIEVVYHLYSMEKRTGPITIKQRTDRNKPEVQSLTPVWRSCELQEREIFDLFGVNFISHPDQRRILMWDEFEGHPMRKDYVEPFDYEWEPTPHDEILDKHQRGKVIV
ncbi:MAG: NADH-quinone oxidoreductase subunit C [Verrucomicrobiota bacterium]|jgi:NADH-quinone oxidoreductase subunit C|nr:NADH-quinone oxidoreductase subunit C [Verrucomicrobiota bacterium]|tara:strand:+ start:400 stop:975 length:576 start_codon:yes stop_codon:yes gene_type:complete